MHLPYLFEFSPLYLLQAALTIWMLVDAHRRGVEFFWFWVILFFQPFGAWVYFELPGRKRRHPVWFGLNYHCYATLILERAPEVMRDGESGEFVGAFTNLSAAFGSAHRFLFSKSRIRASVVFLCQKYDDDTPPPCLPRPRTRLLFG